jgi:hypothetical protein
MDAGVDSGKANLHCGNTLCSAPAEFCCIADGGTARCVSALAASNCPDSDAKVRCDDHTDCPLVGQVCCALDGIMGSGPTAACRAAGTCVGPGRVEVLCDPQDPSSCGGGSSQNSCRTDNQTIITGYPSCH